MIIAQLTDLHIGFDGRDAECKNSIRLNHVLGAIKSMRRQPDLMLVTGDLIETGADWAYRKLKRGLDALEIPYHLALGNHDSRDAFAGIFPKPEFADGFLQYSLDDYPLRIIVLDTLEAGKHGGGFCEVRANWLAKELAKYPDRPTLIAMHHPPIETGIGWMTAQADAPWVSRFKVAIAPHDQIVRIICGHIHRSIFKPFGQTHVAVSLAVAPQVALELDDIDPYKPDGRPLLTDAAPAYCLHHWDGRELTTHNATAANGHVIVNFDAEHAFIVPHTLDLE